MSRSGIHGPFDFVLDIACFHGLPGEQRQAYAQEVARVTRSRAIFMLLAVIAGGGSRPPGVPAIREEEISERFGHDFTVESIQTSNGRFTTSMYTLRRQ